MDIQPYWILFTKLKTRVFIPLLLDTYLDHLDLA